VKLNARRMFLSVVTLGELQAGMSVATRNMRDFDRLGVRVVDPFHPAP
jgi:predicted nucleic acid-binding protein